MDSNPTTAHILLVEDDDIDARAVHRAFEKHHIGNPIIRAIDGIDALERLRGENGKERMPRPFIILLDLNMPRMSGLEFLETLRADAELRSCIVFVLTTSSDDRDITMAYDNQVAGYILKSNAGKDFLNVVQMLEKFIITVQFPTSP